MNASTTEMLRRLGSGESIESVCAWAGMTRDRFDDWWRAETARRAPRDEGVRPAALVSPVRIDRDAYGIPHIHAKTDTDLFFGFGYAMASDRLFQMDYLRRKGRGRLSEVLGPSALELDRLARTVGLERIATAEYETLSGEIQSLLEAFSAGINAWIDL